MLPMGARAVWVRTNLPALARVHRVWCRFSQSSGSDGNEQWLEEMHNSRSNSAAQSKEKLSSNSLTSVMDVFLTSDEEVLERLSRALGDKLESTPRVSLRSRLETLEGLGCTLSQIQAQPEILRISEREVIRRAQMLRDVGAPVSVEFLRAAVVRCPDKLKMRITEIQDRDKFLCEALQCSPEELAKLRQQLPFLETVSRQQTLTEKLRTLASHGVSLADIKSQPGILIRSTKVLTKRLKKLEQMKKAGELETFPKYWLILSEKNFAAVLKTHAEMRTRNAEVQTEMESMLGMPEEEVSAINGSLNLLSPFHVRKVKFLLEAGIPREEIVNHTYLLNSSLARLQEAVEQARGAGVDPPTAIFLISIIHHRRIPHRPSPPRQMAFLAEILNTDLDSLQHLGHSVPQLGFVDKVTLKRNLAFFQSKGFSVEEVRACPLVLMHPSDRMTEYFEALPGMPEFQSFKEATSSNVTLLNVLQYVIEKDLNFGCNVLHAEVEDEENASDVKVPESG